MSIGLQIGEWIPHASGVHQRWHPYPAPCLPKDILDKRGVEEVWYG